MTQVNYALLDHLMEAKVEAAIIAEAKRTGRKISDLSSADLDRIVGGIVDTLSPNEMERASLAGLETIARQVLGEKIAAKIWEAGHGASPSEKQIRQAAKEARIAGEERECFDAFMARRSEIKRDDLEEHPFLGRFAPLLLGAPENTTLGEAATRRAASGDKLALSFLAWKEIT